MIEPLPRPWFSESLTDYARRCALPEASVKGHWETELARIYKEWKEAQLLVPPEVKR